MPTALLREQLRLAKADDEEDQGLKDWWGASARFGLSTVRAYPSLAKAPPLNISSPYYLRSRVGVFPLFLKLLTIPSWLLVLFSSNPLDLSGGPMRLLALAVLSPYPTLQSEEFDDASSLQSPVIAETPCSSACRNYIPETASSDQSLNMSSSKFRPL